jgi:hypothetical protein
MRNERIAHPFCLRHVVKDVCSMALLHVLNRRKDAEECKKEH